MSRFVASLALIALILAATGGAEAKKGGAHFRFHCEPQPGCLDSEENMVHIAGKLRAWLRRMNQIADAAGKDDQPPPAKTEYGVYVGNPKLDHFGDVPVVRILTITPSELTRDVKDEWDYVEFVGGYLAPLSSDDPGPFWIITQNYKWRKRSLIKTLKPSPDWEFYSLADADQANARTQLFADAIKRAAEAEFREEKKDAVTASAGDGADDAKDEIKPSLVAAPTDIVSRAKKGGKTK